MREGSLADRVFSWLENKIWGSYHQNSIQPYTPKAKWPDPNFPNRANPAGPPDSWKNRPLESWETAEARASRIEMARIDGGNDFIVETIIERQRRQQFGAASKDNGDQRSICPYRGTEAMDWLRGYDTGQVQEFWDIKDDIWRDKGVPEERIIQVRRESPDWLKRAFR